MASNYFYVHNGLTAGELTINAATGDINTTGTITASTVIIAGNTVLTTASIGSNAVTSLTAGTDTAVSSSVGSVTVWNTGTLQTVTSRGATTNQAVSITNTTDSTSTSTGALTVSGGVGVAGTATINTANVKRYIDLDTTTTSATEYREGRLWYDSNEHTLNIWGATSSTSALITTGQREWVRCYNNTGATIPKGSPVYVVGVHSHGPTSYSHHPSIALADASNINKKDVIGLAAEDITTGSHGNVVVRGWIEGINTANLVEGQKAHLGFATSGTLVVSAPEYPNYPMDLGICLVSSSTNGTFYVDITDHTFERIRVTGNSYFDDDVTIAGALNVLGTQTTIGVQNLNVENSFIYLGSGDTINSSTFTGSGLNDLTFKGHYEGNTATTYYVKIDSTGTVDTFAWSYNDFSTTEASGISITGNVQTLSHGIGVQFQALTGHTLNNKWSGYASGSNIDFGIIGNYTTATYTHAGIYRDSGDGEFKIFERYDPEITNSIDPSDSTFRYGKLRASAYFATTASFINGSQILVASDLETVTNTATYITNDPTSQTGLSTIAGTSTSYGTYNFGNASSVSVFGDYNTSTNVGFYSINDTNTAPGYVVYIGFTGITEFNRLVANINYTQSSGHTVQVDLYNYTLAQWDTFTTYSGLTGWFQFALGLIDSAEYISGGKVTARFYHVSTGNTGHRTWIDYVALEQSITGGQGPRGATGATGATGAQGVNTSTTATTFNFYSTLTSTGTNSGAVVIDGGAGIAKDVYVGGVIYGTATTANSWTTSRTITLGGDLTGSVSINGSSNVTLTATIAADSVSLGTDTTGLYLAQGATSGFGISGTANTEGATFTVTANSTSANTVSTIVYRDTSGNFSAGTITASLSGTATTATSANYWTTARTITLAGDLTGSVSIDGSAGVTLTATVAADSVSLGTDTTGLYLAQGATSGFGISGTANTEGATFTVTANSTSANTVSTIVYRDTSGNFSAGTITASLSGTATSATNIAGGTAGQLVYQSSPGVTGFVTTAATGQILVSAGVGAPTYTSTGSIFVGNAVTATNLAGGAQGGIPYQTAAGTTAFAPIGTNGFVLRSNGTTATWVSTASLGISGGSGTTFTGGTVTNAVIITSATTAVSTVTGALQVYGGVGIGDNLYVRGVSQAGVRPLQVSMVDGGQPFGPQVNIYSTGTAGSFADPVIELQRWTGVSNEYKGHRIKIEGEDFAIQSTASGPIGSQTYTESIRVFTANSNVGINTSTDSGSRLQVNGSVQIKGVTTITDTTVATSTVSGALQVAGGAGIGQNLYIGGNTVVGTALNFTATNANFQYGGNRAAWVQLAVQNINAGTTASTDIVAFTNNGNDIGGYIDVGITSSAYSDPNYTLYGPGDGYLYVVGTGTTVGKLIFTTLQPQDIIFSTGGGNVEDEIGRWKHGQGLEVAATTNSTSTDTGALTVAGGVGIGGDVTVNGTITTPTVIAGNIIDAGKIIALSLGMAMP